MQTTRMGRSPGFGPVLRELRARYVDLRMSFTGESKNFSSKVGGSNIEREGLENMVIE